MRTSWSRQRGQGGGGCSTSPGANRFGFGSVMPTASDGPPRGLSSAGGVGLGVEVAVGVGVAVGAGAGSRVSSPPCVRTTTSATATAASG